MAETREVAVLVAVVAVVAVVVVVVEVQGHWEISSKRAETVASSDYEG